MTDEIMVGDTVVCAAGGEKFTGQIKEIVGKRCIVSVNANDALEVCGYLNQIPRRGGLPSREFSIQTSSILQITTFTYRPTYFYVGPTGDRFTTRFWEVSANDEKFIARYRWGQVIDVPIFFGDTAIINKVVWRTNLGQLPAILSSRTVTILEANEMAEICANLGIEPTEFLYDLDPDSVALCRLLSAQTMHFTRDYAV